MSWKFTNCRKFLSLYATLMSGLQALKRPCFVTIYSNRSTPFWGWNCMRNEASSRLFSLQIALRIPHWEKSDLSNHRMTNWRCGPFLLRFSSGLPSPLWRGQRLSRPFGISLKCKHCKNNEILNKRMNFTLFLFKVTGDKEAYISLHTTVLHEKWFQFT